MNLQYIKNKVNACFAGGNERSVAVKKNIAASLLLKCISILVSLQVVPLTIGYVNPTKYGIWLTLSSIIAWLSYFDLGFAHGFRNRFAEAKARGDMKLAKEYVSTTYAVLLFLFSVILLITLVANSFLDWSHILNIDPIYKDELSMVFGLLACFFCLNVVASIFTTMLMADQKPALASLIQTGGQVLAFGCIYVLTKTTSGGLTALAVAFSGVPCFLLVVVSIFMFHGRKYKAVSPALRCVRFSLTRKILGLGGQFFVIQIACLVVFSTSNFFIIRFGHPQDVTLYNIAFKYFSIVTMGFTIIITPFWSAATDAYVRKDFGWIRRGLRLMLLLWGGSVVGTILMLLLSDMAYSYWVGMKIPFSYSLLMCVYVIVFNWNNLFAYFLNGIGRMWVQLYASVLSAAIFISTALLLGNKWKVDGICVAMCCSLLVSSVALPIQYFYIICKGKLNFWNK